MLTVEQIDSMWDWMRKMLFEQWYHEHGQGD